MSHRPVVMRQLAVGESAALPARARPIADPRTTAIDLVTQAAREEGLRQGREQGLQEGYDEGLRQGRAAARSEAVTAAAAIEARAKAQGEQRQAELGAAVAAFQRAAQEWLVLAEEDMVALCYETIARVFGSVAATPEGVRAQAVQLLEQWRGRDAPALRLHPLDAQLLEGLATHRPFTCVADPEVAYGGCLARAEGGALDARLDRILEEAKAILISARQGRALPGDAQ